MKNWIKWALSIPCALVIVAGLIAVILVVGKAIEDIVIVYPDLIKGIIATILLASMFGWLIYETASTFKKLLFDKFDDKKKKQVSGTEKNDVQKR